MTKTITLLLLVFAGGLAAQTRVQLSLPDLVFPGGDAVICAPLVADSFPDIAGIQFAVGWDATQLNFVEVRYGDNPLGLGEARTGMPEADNFGVSFTTDDLMGISLKSGTQIMELCFTAANASGSSPLTFTGYLIPEFVQEGQIVAFPFDTLPGSITYGPDVAVTVLPGDTNRDREVNHEDLLPIGLLHGTSGPARPTGSLVFAPASAPAWPETLPGGANAAHADADGNGAVAGADLAVVRAFYGRRRDGLQDPPPPAAGRSLVPGLTLSGGPLRANQPTTLTVSLGDGNDPAASGYGLAFTLTFDPTHLVADSFSVDYSNSYLGQELLTLDTLSPTATGRLEIALSRTDQQDATATGREVCRITVLARENAAEEDYLTPLALVPNGFRRADGSSPEIAGSTGDLTVESTVANREPAWGRQLRLYPNPVPADRLYLGGPLPRLREITLLDVTGRRIRQYAGRSRSLDLSGLPAGTYTLQLIAATSILNRRVIKR